MTKRRGKGEGQVYQREDGRCIGEYDDANGGRRYVSGYTRFTRMASFAKLPSALSVPPRSLASHPARQRFARVGRCHIVLLAFSALPTCHANFSAKGATKIYPRGYLRAFATVGEPSHAIAKLAAYLTVYEGLSPWYRTEGIAQKPHRNGHSSNHG
jgi:hypothetical protein